MAFKYTEEQLNKLDKELLIQLFLGLQEQLEALTAQTEALNTKMQQMMEQLILSNKNRFGRSSEKILKTGINHSGFVHDFPKGPKAGKGWKRYEDRCETTWKSTAHF